MKKIYHLVCFLAMAITATAQHLVSPSGEIVLELDGTTATISRNGTTAVTLPRLGIDDGKARLSSIDDVTPMYIDYTMPVGKKSRCQNRANQYTARYVDSEGHPFKVEFMVCDDGVAFRYVGPIRNEQTRFAIPEGMVRFFQKYRPDYEGQYPRTTASEPGKYAFPALYQAADSLWVLLSESGIERGHAAGRLENRVSSDRFDVVAAGEGGNRSSTPWRVAIVGSLPQVFESTLVTDVAPAPMGSDWDWVAPGSVSWIYWAYNHGSNDFQIVKRYIDFARHIGFPYMLIDAEWDEMANGGDIRDAIRYAREQDVKLMMWYNSSTGWIDGAPGPQFRLNDPRDRDEEFARLEKRGIKGVKIDFFDGDGPEVMNYCIDLLESAARHHLMVNFHGATIPRGWQRTYPNFMTAEGVYGAEWYNNKPHMTTLAASHNATLPFTRNVVGPMDYTPCTFSDSQHPHITTHAHELALPVIFESALQHWADRPESYNIQPQEVIDFIGELPTVWDESVLLGGYPGESVAVARRKGKIWYVGIINGLDRQNTITLDWSRLGHGRFNVQTFADAVENMDGDGLHPDQLWNITTERFRSSELPATISLAPRSGQVMRIVRLERRKSKQTSEE